MSVKYTVINIHEAIKGHLDTLRHFGDPIPEPSSLTAEVERPPRYS